MLIFDNPLPKKWCNVSELDAKNAEFKKFFGDLLEEHQPDEIELEYVVVNVGKSDSDKPAKVQRERFIGFSRRNARFLAFVSVESQNSENFFPINSSEFHLWKPDVRYNNKSGFAVSTYEIHRVIFHFGQSAPNKKKSGVLEHYAND